MLLAAFSSRSKMSPPFVQTWVRTERLIWIRAPHPLHSWNVYAGFTASTRVHSLPLASTRVHSLAGACCLASEDTEEVVPPGVVNTLVEAGLLTGSVVLVVALLSLFGCREAAQVRGPNSLNVDRVVRAHQRE